MEEAGDGPVADTAVASPATGLQYNVPMRLVVRQSGRPDIGLVARYDPKPFAEVPYYDIKVGMARSPRSFELEIRFPSLGSEPNPSEASGRRLRNLWMNLTK